MSDRNGTTPTDGSTSAPPAPQPPAAASRQPRVATTSELVSAASQLAEQVAGLGIGGGR